MLNDIDQLLCFLPSRIDLIYSHYILTLILWGGAQHARTFLKCVLLQKFPLEPMMKPPSKFLFFAIFSHGMFAFSQNCVFLVLFQFAPYSCGGGAQHARTLF